MEFMELTVRFPAKSTLRALNLGLVSILCSVLLAGPVVVSAQTDELLVTKVDGTSKAVSPVDAAREIQESVSAEAARSHVLEILGEKRYQKNKALIDGRIIRQASKFIPFVNAAQPVQQPDGSWKASVELRVDTASLRRMILEAGLLNDAEGPASMLPLISFVDRSKGVLNRWWIGEPKDEANRFLSQVAKQFHETFQGEFSRQGFHMIRPQGSQTSPLPEAYRVERPSQSDLVYISDYFMAPLVVRGDVRFRESRGIQGAFIGSVKLQVQHVASGRIVAEVTRQFETDAGGFENVVRAKLKTETPEIAKDLAVQVLEAWQRGTLNTNSIRLAVRGELSPKQLSDLKSGLVSNVREVKAIKERLFEGRQVHFELDYTGPVAQLSEKLRSLKLASFETQVTENSERGISMDVKAR
jgi:hypothetical protein